MVVTAGTAVVFSFPIFPTFGFWGTRGPLTSADMRDTDFLGGKAGRFCSIAGGSTLDSSPASPLFTARSVGRPPEVRVGRGGGTGAALSEGLEIRTLFRLGGRAGDDSLLK